jgi:hypothetical protein
VRAHGESGWTARLVPLTVDGLIYASSMVMLDSARRKDPVPGLARWLLGLGIAATLAANVAHGLGHGPVGAAVAAWPAVALVGSYELLMVIIRGAQSPEVNVSEAEPERGPEGEPLQELFAGDLAADRVPSVRAIRAQLHVGQARAQRLRDYLATELQGGWKVPLREQRANSGVKPTAEARGQLQRASSRRSAWSRDLLRLPAEARRSE